MWSLSVNEIWPNELNSMSCGFLMCKMKLIISYSTVRKTRCDNIEKEQNWGIPIKMIANSAQ